MVEAVVVLTLMMIIGALVAVATPNLLYSVVSIGAVGFLLSITFLFLAAPDLAITQIAVEVITLVFLLRVTSADRKKRTADAASGDGESSSVWTVRRLGPIAVVAALGVLSFLMLGEFPEFGENVMDRFSDAPSRSYLQGALTETGAANVVTAVLLDFRGYDTLGEATILFCAVVGALSVLRRRAKRQSEKADGEDER